MVRDPVVQPVHRRVAIGGGRAASFQEYYQRGGNEIRARLSNEDPDYLLSVDPDEYLDCLIQEARWEPPVLYEQVMTIEPINVKSHVLTSLAEALDNFR